jgi:signal transduction histidine kinase
MGSPTDLRLAELLSFNYWVLLTHILAASVFVWLTLAVFLRARRTPLLFTYLAFQAAFFIWLIAKALASATFDPGVKWLFVVIQYVGFCSLTPAFFVFAFSYARGRLPRLRLMAPIAAPSALFFLAVVSNPIHGLFFASWDIYGFSPGILFYPHRAYEYGLGIVGAILWSRGVAGSGRNHRFTVSMFFAAILAPLSSNVIFLVRADLFPFDPTPIGFTLSIVFLSVTIFRWQLLDIVPVARRAALRHSPEGLMLLDSRGQPLAWNESFQRALTAGRLRPLSVHGPVERFLDRASAVARQATGIRELPREDAGIRNGASTSEHVVESAGGCHYRVVCVPVLRLGRSWATVIKMIDVTQIVVMRKDLAERMHELDLAGQTLRRQAQMAREIAEMRARNSLARDVHDILGHSVMLVISILEVARLSPLPAEGATWLASAERILRDCLEDVRATLAGAVRPSREGLVPFLEAAAQEVRRAGVEVDLLVQGWGTRLDSARIEALSRICQEALTNSLRHGAATRIGIALRTNVSGCELYVVDNGRGARTIQKGFGLTGIEERLAELGGEARFLSDGESGFVVRAFVPHAGQIRAAHS